MRSLRTTFLVPALVFLFAGPGCAHRQLRQTLRIDPSEKLTKDNIAEAWLNLFPLGTPYELMKKELPPSAPSEPGLQSPWVVKFETKPKAIIIMSEDAQLCPLIRSFWKIEVDFEDDKQWISVVTRWVVSI